MFYFVEYTDMSMTQVIQRQSVHFSGSLVVLRYLLTQLAGNIKTLDGDKKMRAFDAVDVSFDNKIVTIEVFNFNNIHLGCVRYINYFLI